MIVGQNSALGRIHAGQIVTVHVAEHTVTIDLGADGTRAIRRTTTQAVRSRITTSAPSRRNRPAMARPGPVVPPVIIARFPSSNPWSPPPSR